MRHHIARPAVHYEIMRVIGLVGANYLRIGSGCAVKQAQRIDPFSHPIDMTAYDTNTNPLSFQSARRPDK
jgi:hypothetical protein